jgi:hypothetical protein
MSFDHKSAAYGRGELCPWVVIKQRSSFLLFA